MNRDQIKSKIDENLRQAGLEAQEIRVQPDPFSGWRIAVISAQFEGMAEDDRRSTVLKGLENLTVQWLDLLTPAEMEWEGSLLTDVEADEIPMWPEALARTDSAQPVIFPSNLEEDLERPIIATFYSLRGGVGRSTALAYTARILASRGRSVLCVDMDLEAPGLAALFGKEHELEADKGLVALLIDLDLRENLNEKDVIKHIIRLSEMEEIYLLPAGIPDANYARRLRLLDPEAWYREEDNPLRRLFALISNLSFKPDVVLVDARTGLTPISAPLLFDLSDLAIVTFFPHPQAFAGTQALVRALLHAHSWRTVAGRFLTPEPRFLVSPIPASKTSDIQRYRERATEWITDWMSLMGPRRYGIDVEEITHLVPYRELLANSDGIMDSAEVWHHYEQIADWLERFIPTEFEEKRPVELSSVKDVILRELDFSTGTAESQKNFLDSFVETELFEKVTDFEKPLVLGRKGTGKTAMFRRILEGGEYKSVVALSPAKWRESYPWVLSPEGFQAIEEFLVANRREWKQFWMPYIALAVFLTFHRKSQPFPLEEAVREPVERLVIQHDISERGVIACLKQLIEKPESSLQNWDWLKQLDGALDADIFVMFDGLDTGFGNSQEGRERRIRATEGLFSFIIDRETSLKRMHFKVFLREDIWRRLRFENKSHLYGRSVSLQWRSLAEYAKTVLKQAIRSPEFKQLVTTTIPECTLLEVSRWSDEAVFKAWNILVGERMKGGNTTFTKNWVWSRLADGNGDHSPRNILQLFREATIWESKEHQNNPYDRTVIRPRALQTSLDEVSEQALQALQEEFEELGDLIKRLSVIGRTPVEASELANFGEQLTLAREVGLIEVYEGTEEDIRRYRVPDLYRLALGMTRKGQA